MILSKLGSLVERIIKGLLVLKNLEILRVTVNTDPLFQD